MGQCSTLPAETRPSSASVTSKLEMHQARDPLYEQRHRLRDDGRKESLDFNKIIPSDPKDGPEFSVSQDAKTYKEMSAEEMKRQLQHQRQSRDPEAIRAAAESPVPMETEREEVPPMQPLPPPPDIAVRTRCYKLNLDSEIAGLNGSSSKQHGYMGPFAEPPPFLTYSSSEDSSLEVSATTVAIQTAQIFRGITVGRDGTILTQNARATRSNRGKANKRGEKSRQASKIDKAKDLVEETIETGKAPDSDDPATMISLIIVGEYDDMKYLVRDGSKKLRDAAGLPDEHLVSINQPRANTQQTSSTPDVNTNVTSPRKRVSTSMASNHHSSHRSNPSLQSPEKIQATSNSGHHHSSSSAAPPKLKSNPRDTRPGRREIPKVRLDSCSDFMDPRRGANADGDWSHAWNIWNCGGGAVSPFQPSSPTGAGNPPSKAGDYQNHHPSSGNNYKQHQQPLFEGREASGHKREGATAARAD